MLRARIKGKNQDYTDGIASLEALRLLGVEVPKLGNNDRLKPQGVCRLCAVTVEGLSHPVVSCYTPLTECMVIDRDTAQPREERRGVPALLAHCYPKDAGNRFPDKPLHRYFVKHGLRSEAAGKPDPMLIDDSHPYIRVDRSRCIDCYRCLHIREQVQRQLVWPNRNRQAESRPVPNPGASLRESSGVSCGACVDTCPTDAPEDKLILSDARIKRPVPRRGKLRVIDPRQIELSRHVEIQLALRPGIGVAPLNGLLRVLIEGNR